MVERTNAEGTTLPTLGGVACSLCPADERPTMIYGPARATYLGRPICSECADVLRPVKSPAFWESKR